MENAFPMISHSRTYVLPGGQTIETSAEARGGRVRLRARLVRADGTVQEALSRTYDTDDPRAVADFEAEFFRLAGVPRRPLFPLSCAA